IGHPVIGRSVIAAACVVVLLAVHNVVIERLARWMYVPACVTSAACVIVLGAAAGLSAADMGLTVPRSGAGLVAGLIVALIVVALIVLAAAAPTTRRLFADRRMTGVGPAGAAYRAAVRIPLGTVLIEEVAFRGVLLVLLAAVVPLGWAVAATCALFGLWHVVPTAATLDVNGISDPKDRGALLAATVGAMAVAGALLCWLRLASGSLAAPAVVHASATAAATVAAYVVQRDAVAGDEVGGRHGDRCRRYRRADPPSRSAPPPPGPPPGAQER
ncbi:MAG: protease family protein, partial [Actinomycetota bacterium]|nr:protease family protein [Actinomycetota bacterium]